MKFLAPAPWPEITKTLRTGRLWRIAVTAYLQTGAFEMLPLRRGDMLVVNASDSTLKGGATNPNEIEKFVKVGVKCYSVDALHGKIYVADDRVIIGSANGTTNSRMALLESCVFIQRQDLADEIRGWIDSLPLVPIDATWLGENRGKYKPPKWGKAAVKRFRAKARVWITWLDRDLDEPKTKAYRSKLSDANALLRGKGAEPWPISETGKKPSRMFKSLLPGDLVIAVSHDDDGIVVYPPLRVLVRPWTANVDGKSERFVFLEDDQRDPITLPQFRAALSKAGVKGFPSSGKSDREIPQRAAARLRASWR